MIYRNDVKGMTENATSGTPFRVQDPDDKESGRASSWKIILSERNTSPEWRGLKRNVHVIFLRVFFQNLYALKKKEEGDQGGRKCIFHS